MPTHRLTYPSNIARVMETQYGNNTVELSFTDKRIKIFKISMQKVVISRAPMSLCGSQYTSFFIVDSCEFAYPASQLSSEITATTADI